MSCRSCGSLGWINGFGFGPHRCTKCQGTGHAPPERPPLDVGRFPLTAAVLACPFESYHDRMICEDVMQVTRAIAVGRNLVKIGHSSTHGHELNYSPRAAAETLRDRAVQRWHRL